MRIFGFAGLVMLVSASAALAQTVSGSYPLGIRHVPLPPGEWRVAGTATPDQTTREGMVRYDTKRVLLVQEDATRVRMAIWAQAGQASARIQWAGTPAACNTSPYHRIVVTVEQWEHNCGKLGWWRPSTPVRIDPDDVWPPYIERASERRSFLPERFLYVQTRMANAQGYLDVTYYINPEAYDVPIDRKDWAVNAWNPSIGSTVHAAYIERLKRWMSGIMPQVQKGFFDRAPGLVPAF
jgi:hypothetical protein